MTGRAEDERFTDEQLALWADWAVEPPGVEPARVRAGPPARAAGLLWVNVIPDLADYRPPVAESNREGAPS